MEELMIFTGILEIALFILFIILFAQVCSITNYVSQIKRGYLSSLGVPQKPLPNERVMLKLAIINKDPNIEKLLFDNLFLELHNAFYTEGNGQSGATAYYSANMGIYCVPIYHAYKKLYELAELPFPEQFDSDEKIVKFMRELGQI